MSRVARFAIRRPWLVLASWLIATVALGLVGRGVESKVLPTQLLVPGTEAAHWDSLRHGHFGEDAVVLLEGPRREIGRQGPPLARDLALRPGTRALSPWSAGQGAERLRPSPTKAVIALDLKIPKGETRSTIVPPLERFINARVSPPLVAHTSGEAPIGKELNEATTDGAHRAELIAAPVLIIVLLLVFRSPVAAAIPLVMGQGTVFAAFGVISIILDFASLDAISLSLASGVGLALGVDYSLLIITRFREALEQGLAPRQAASLAANTAGRTAVFAGTVLVSIMLVSFFLSPGTVLLSSAVGAIVSATLSMVSAALVAPAAVRLLGHNVNRWSFGGRGREGSIFSGLVRRVSSRPALAAALVLAILLIIASPVGAMEMIPPDPRQLPKGSKGLDDYDRVRAAGFGPTVEVAIEAPRGTVMDPSDLKEIDPFERRLARIHDVSAAFGPGTLSQQTRALRDAPRAVRRARRNLRQGERDLSRAARQLAQATSGVRQLRGGRLGAAFGARRLRAGSAHASEGSGRLAAGNRRAAAGAGELTAGAHRARVGSADLARGNQELSDRLSGELAPGADRLATELRAGQGRLTALRAPARITEQQTQAAFNTLNRMTIGKTDPLFGQALQQVGTALGAATGRNPLTGAGVAPGYSGLDASIAQAASEAGRAADGAARLAAGAREASTAARQLAAGANRLHNGLIELERGNARLERGLGRLAAGSAELRRGLARIDAGSGELAEGLESGNRRSAPLESGLAQGRDEAATGRDQLITRSGPFRQLRALDQLQNKSPNFFDSGYVQVAALDGAHALDRDASTFLVDADKGGGEVGRISILPNVPTNDPRTTKLIDNVEKETRRFEKDSGLDAAVGGTAAKMVDYDRVTSGRLPLLVAMIALVTFLMLVLILRSLFLPAIAVILNLITVAAAFGVLSLLFVGDNPPLGGAGALDVLSVATIFTITFALSIDYQVFLLTRMREEFVRTQSNNAAIEFGIEKTARVVTGAAAIMIAVFTAFALSDFVVLKQFGVGLATAVLIDATIVRLVLLPATMRLFGLTTWWLPEWLDDRLPVLDVEGSEYAHESESMQPARA
ncbi:MAG TPA: MMPL family transporter [Thermoleophilaceae bacterium]|nr:MMPL family transporter [Thermoleophilaceae bacterium]